MSRYTWILDPGHGEFTPGKRFKEFHEWEFNRAIANRVVALCPAVDIRITNPGPVDAGVMKRWQYAKGLQEQNGNCVFLSIHGNAAGKGKTWHPAHGATAFHHPKDKRGKILAKWLLEAIDAKTDINVDRGVKTSRFSVLAGTMSMPSALLECEFFTNEWGYVRMMSPEGRDGIAQSIAYVIHQMEETGEL